MCHHLMQEKRGGRRERESGWTCAQAEMQRRLGPWHRLPSARQHTFWNGVLKRDWRACMEGGREQTEGL